MSMTLDQFLAQWHSPQPCLTVNTSGSTGAPKELLVEKRRMLNSARVTCDFLGLRPGDTALLCLPLDFIAGKMMVVRALERQLRLVAVQPTGHPFATSDMPAVLHLAALVPLQVYNSLQDSTERLRLMQVRNLLIGGGAVDPALERQLKNFPHAVWSTYGMTETLSHIALRRLNGPHSSLWYEPFDGVTLSLNGSGCLVISAPQVCAETLVTNDMAEFHADGRRFRILGRRDNTISSGGLKIQLEEIERILRPHLAADFMATWRADSRLGQALVLLVAPSCQENEVATICRKHLPPRSQPQAIIPVGRLPQTPTGKPKRDEAHRLAQTVLSEGER